MSEAQTTSTEQPRKSHDGDSSRDSQDRGRPQNRRPRYRRKVLDTRNLKLDYKHPDVLERFISKTGKILPRRMTGATAKVQRQIAREIKRARQINLLPVTRR